MELAADAPPSVVLEVPDVAVAEELDGVLEELPALVEDVDAPGESADVEVLVAPADVVLLDVPAALVDVEADGGTVEVVFAGGGRCAPTSGALVRGPPSDPKNIPTPSAIAATTSSCQVGQVRFSRIPREVEPEPELFDGGS